MNRFVVNTLINIKLYYYNDNYNNKKKKLFTLDIVTIFQLLDKLNCQKLTVHYLIIVT